MNPINNANSHYRGTLLTNEPMSKHTTWRLGGCADLYYIPADRQDLVEFIKCHNDKPIYFVGLGSNLLVRDSGIRGVVINMTNAISSVTVNDGLLTIDSGVPCAIVSRKVRELGYVGLEFMSGIPGTIGGALRMNAGAHGDETWDFVESVTLITRQGEIRKKLKSDFDISYRTVSGLEDDEWFLSADFKLDKGDLEESKEKVKSLLEHRSNTQPTKMPNAGSVFKNPKGHYAAQIIEGCGLKGKCIGGACVSDKHANFIINTGNAKANDVEELINLIKTEVMLQKEIDLVPEVRIIGEQ